MAVNVREKSIEEFEEKLSSMATALTKINYLESALKEAGFSFEIKRFLWEELGKLYAKRKMLEKAAKAYFNKAGMEFTFQAKIDSYTEAAELYSKAGRVEDADQMFTMASRDANKEQKAKIRLARKNIYFTVAHDLEIKGKRASASKFYEKLIKMGLDDVEKEEVKEKLLTTYKALGLFREARLIEGL